MFMKQVETITLALAKSEAIAFLEWVRDNDVYPCRDSWNYDGMYHTIEQLYSLFKESQNENHNN